MTTLQADTVAAVGDVLERAVKIGQSSNKRTAKATRALVLSLRVELWVETVAMASLARALNEGTEVDHGLLNVARRSALTVLAGCAVQPAMFGEMFNLSPIDGFVDGLAAVRAVQQELARRGRL